MISTKCDLRLFSYYGCHCLEPWDICIHTYKRSTVECFGIDILVLRSKFMIIAKTCQAGEQAIDTHRSLVQLQRAIDDDNHVDVFFRFEMLQQQACQAANIQPHTLLVQCNYLQFNNVARFSRSTDGFDYSVQFSHWSQF